MFIYYDPNPRKRHRDAGDCVIRAIAKATGQSWENVYTQLAVHGFITGTWGNENATWHGFLKSIGYKAYMIPDTCPDCYTVADFAHDHPKGTYILATGTHAVAVVDGNWYDKFDSADEVPTHFYTKEEQANADV